jgi:hypothetical protein
VFFCLHAVFPLFSQEGSGIIIVSPPPEIKTGQDKAAPEIPDKSQSSLSEKPQLPLEEIKEVVPDKTPQAVEPVATAAAPIKLQEFKSDPLSGKPALDETGQKIHFYSDPAPLINEPRVESEEDAALRQLELERVFPVVDAPAGLFDFSVNAEKLKIIASHSYDNVAIKAGQTFGMNFLLANHRDQKYVLRENVIVASGARSAYEIASFKILPGQTCSRRVAFFLDASIAPGVHEAVYQLLAESDQAIVSQLKFKFAIASLPRLSFKLNSATRIEEAAEFKVMGTIENRGNVDLHIALSIDGRAESLTVMPNRISLPVGGHAMVEIIGIAPAKSHPLDDSLVLDLSAETEQESGNLKLLEQQLKLRLADSQVGSKRVDL